MSSSQRTVGSDTTEDTENTTMIVTSTNGRGETCYSVDAVRDDIVTRMYVQSGWLQQTDNATHFKSKEPRNLNFWFERPGQDTECFKMVWVEFGCPDHGNLMSVGCPQSHGKIKGHSRHHAREGSHIDRTDHVDNSSVSALVSHFVHEGVAHGAHRYEG